MNKRTRIHPIQFYLNDDEQYILEEKYRLSRMKSKSAFLRKMILYGHQNLSKYLKQDAPEIQRSSHNQLTSL